MIITVICYTVCSLNDKYTVSKAKFNGNEFTFLMASATSFFMLFALPMSEIYFAFSWQSFLAVLLVVIIKWLEFQCSARVLTELSAFELKAWLGITLFFSYITDLMMGSKVLWLKFLFIGITAVGLFFIAQAGRKEQVQYRKIILPLIVYLAVKFGYGVTVRLSKPYVNSTLLLFIGFIILTLILLFIGLIRKERYSRKSLIGSIICIIGIVGFQLAKI